MHLIDAVYEAGTDFGKWGLALELLADWVGAEDAGLGVAAAGAIPWLVAPRTDPDFIALYPHYQSSDVIWQNIVRRGPGGALADASVFELAELEGNAFHNEWSVPQGYHYRLGATLFDDAESQTVLILPCRDVIDRDQLSRLDAILPHLRRALRFSIGCAREQSFARSSEALVEVARQPIIAMDCTGRVLNLNAAAERWLAASNGGVAKLSDLARHLSALVPEANFTDVTISPGLRLRSLPLRPPSQPPLPGCPAILFYGATLEDADRIEILRRTFGLTRAEAKLALEMRHGDGRRGAAARRGISYATARSHLTRIFDKMGVSRQAELVRMLGEIDVISGNGKLP